MSLLFSQEGRQRVAQLLEAVEALTGAERLLLYLRLPTGVPPHDPLKQPVNPLGSRYVHYVLKIIKTTD